MDLDCNSVTAGAVHVLVGVSLKDEGVVDYDNGTRQSAFAKAQTEADAAWLIAGQTNSEDPVGVRSEDFADISRIASTIADSSDRGIKIERAAILRDAAALVKGKQQLRQRQIGAEVFRVAGQVFAAELLKLLVLAIEEELTHLLQVRQGTGIDLVG